MLRLNQLCGVHTSLFHAFRIENGKWLRHCLFEQLRVQGVQILHLGLLVDAGGSLLVKYLSLIELLVENEAVEVGIDCVFIRAHECEKLWHDGEALVSTAMLYGHCVGEDVLQVLCGLRLRLVEREKHLRLDPDLLVQGQLRVGVQGLWTQASHEEVLEEVVQGQAHAGGILHL